MTTPQYPRYEPPPPQVRVPIATPRFSPVRMVGNLVRFASGGMSAATARRFRDDAHPEAPAVTAMTFSPLTVKESSASYVFDAKGVRLEGYRRLRLTVAWAELARVDLEVESSAALGLESLRVAVWPHDPPAFAAAHRGVEATWDDTIGTWSLVLGKGPQVPRETIEAALLGLRHAGERFSGELRRSFR